MASLRCWAPLLAPMLIHPNCWKVRSIALLVLTTVFGEVADLPAIVARVPVGVNYCGGLTATSCCYYARGGWLYYCYCERLPQNSGRGQRDCPVGGVWIMRYIGGAPLKLPPEGPAMALFLFFSSAASQAFMVPSWSMATLASSLYDRFSERIRQSYS
jgi:hypothetical protein